jgi:hypothetical protein
MVTFGLTNFYRLPGGHLAQPASDGGCGDPTLMMPSLRGARVSADSNEFASVPMT